MTQEQESYDRECRQGTPGPPSTVYVHSLMCRETSPEHIIWTVPAGGNSGLPVLPRSDWGSAYFRQDQAANHKQRHHREQYGFGFF